MTKNQTIVITGSSSGIGLDLARAFVQRGANVVLNGRDQTKLVQAAASLGVPGQVAYVAGNIGAPETGDTLVRTAVDRFGGIDMLVNNAGDFAPKAFVEVS